MVRLKLALVALAFLCLIGCGGGDEGERANSPPAATADPPPARVPQGGTLRFLALGDSYTKGEGVTAGERWPVQLAAKLRDAGLDVADPLIIAETGWRTDDLNAGIDGASPKGPFHLVALLIGVNNQFQGHSAAAYRGEFDTLLRRAVALAGGEPSRVLVFSIPDYGATPYGRMSDPAGIAAGVKQFNAVNHELSKNAGVRYVDLVPVSRTAASDPDLTARDDLHPSGKMYAAWVELALPEAKAALGRRTTTTRPAASDSNSDRARAR